MRKLKGRGFLDTNRRHFLMSLLLVLVGLACTLGVTQVNAAAKLPVDELSFKPGLSELQVATFPYKGDIRKFGISFPTSFDKDQKSPVLVLLGLGFESVRAGRQLFQGGNESQRIVTVVPVPADGTHWLNDGLSPQSTKDDVGFVIALVEYLTKEVNNLDGKRVYLAGISNGGNMVNRICYEHPDLIAAATSIIGAIPRKWVDQSPKRAPVPIMLINGDQDPIFQWEGGTVEFLQDKDGWKHTASQVDYIEFWQKRNGSVAEPKTLDYDDVNTNDSSTVTRIDYGASKQGAPVVMLHVKGGGHTLPSLADLSAMHPPALGPANRDVDAVYLAMQFMTQWKRNKQGCVVRIDSL